ncbi:hypothetical protein D3C87_1622860 [compost metagenome]
MSCRPRLFGHLRPNSLPVLRPEVTSSDRTAGSMLNGRAVLDRDRPATRAPLIDKRRGYAHTSSEHRGADRSIPVEVIVQIHGSNYSVAIVYLQAML